MCAFPIRGRGDLAWCRPTSKEPGQVMQIVETVWGVNAMGPNWIIVVDADADIDDWNDIWWRMYSRTEPHRDVWITPPRQHGGHQPLVKHGFTSRIAIDATSKFKGVEFPEINTRKPRALRESPDAGRSSVWSRT